MPLYNVEVISTAYMVINADDEKTAVKLAEKYREEAQEDVEILMIGEVKSKEDLSHDWDDMCWPYGGKKPIKDYLKSS